MEAYKPETMKDFEMLKRNDCIIVQWSDNYIKHTPKSKKISCYNIYQVKKDDKEVICKRKDNHYFNYKMYLEGKSTAEEVLIIASDSYIKEVSNEEFKRLLKRGLKQNGCMI